MTVSSAKCRFLLIAFFDCELVIDAHEVKLDKLFGLA